MLSSIVSHPSENTNPPEFDPVLTVDAPSSGGTITLEPRFEEWLGETLVRVELPGHRLALRTWEARDLANALLNLAAFIDEEAVAK